MAAKWTAKKIEYVKRWGVYKDGELMLVTWVHASAPKALAERVAELLAKARA